jgi:hypothetical protein
MPERIQWSPRDGALPANTVRPSRIWSNPFRVVKALGAGPAEYQVRLPYGEPYATTSTRKAALAEAVDLFDLHTGAMGSIEWSAESVDELIADLGGKDLACSHPVGGPCHVDILLRRANRES